MTRVRSCGGKQSAGCLWVVSAAHRRLQGLEEAMCFSSAAPGVTRSRAEHTNCFKKSPEGSVKCYEMYMVCLLSCFLKFCLSLALGADELHPQYLIPES